MTHVPGLAHDPRDLGRPVPAVALTGWRTRVRMPRPGLTFPVVMIAGSLFALLVEARDGWSHTARVLIAADVPLAAVWGAALLVGIGTLVARLRNPRPSWYRWWSFVDQQEEPGGVRLRSNRASAQHPGVLVRRGEHVELHAVLVYKRGQERQYGFRVLAPDGEIAFTAPVHIEKLSMAALEQQATRWGFTLSTHGEADRIRRGVSGVVPSR